jgi:phosphohistidine phosphatase SixA
VSHILASPFLRTIETAVPLSKASNVLIKLEASVWETGCRNPPPSHQDKEFPLHKEGYESCFIPECGEHPSEFRPRLARSAAVLLDRFPHGSGNVAIFSHADPVAYLVTELCGMDPTLTGPMLQLRCSDSSGGKERLIFVLFLILVSLICRGLVRQSHVIPFIFFMIGVNCLKICGIKKLLIPVLDGLRNRTRWTCSKSIGTNDTPDFWFREKLTSFQ